MEQTGRSCTVDELKQSMVNVDDDCSGTLRYREFANLLLRDEGFLADTFVQEDEPFVGINGSVMFPDFVPKSGQNVPIKELKKLHARFPGLMRKEARGHLMVQCVAGEDDEAPTGKRLIKVRIAEAANLTVGSSSVQCGLVTNGTADSTSLKKSDVVSSYSPKYAADFTWEVADEDIGKTRVQIAVRSRTNLCDCAQRNFEIAVWGSVC